MGLGDTGIESGGSIFGIALVQVPLCSFGTQSAPVLIWVTTGAGFSAWMEYPLSVL